MRLLGLFTSTFTIGLIVLAAPKALATTIVVLPLGVGGTSTATDDAMTDDVRSAIAELRAASVQPGAATNESVAAARALGISCLQREPACLAQIGALAGGDLVVGGSAIALPDGTSVTLRLVDIASERLVRTEDLLIPAAGGTRAKKLRELAIKLVTPEKMNGSIVVMTRQGATVQLDGKVQGAAPLPNALVVKPGHHEVYAALNGYISASASIDVGIGEQASVVLDLKRDADGDGEPDEQNPLHDRPENNEPEAGRVAVLALVVGEGVTLSPRIQRAILDSFAFEMSKLENLAVIPLSDVERQLPDDVAVFLACPESACWRKIATELQLEEWVVLHVDSIGDTLTLSASLFEAGAQTDDAVIERAQGGIQPGNPDAFAPAIEPIVRQLFPGQSVRYGEVRGIDHLYVGGAKRGLPPWVFWTAITTTGVTATTAGALAAWGAVEEPPLKDAVLLSMWVAVGATAALVAADVAVALSTDWRQ